MPGTPRQSVRAKDERPHVLYNLKQVHLPFVKHLEVHGDTSTSRRHLVAGDKEEESIIRMAAN